MSEPITPTEAPAAEPKTIRLRMARATLYDESTVSIIHGILDDVFGGSDFSPAGFPRGTDGQLDEKDPQFFDPENKEHLSILYNRLQAVIEPNPGAMFRVAFGYNTLAHPENAIIDPDADTIQWHPRFHRQDMELEHLRKTHAELMEIPLSLTSEEVAAAMKQNARIPRSGLALAELLARHRIIQRHAIDDAEDYDGCATLDRIYAAHMEMISDNDRCDGAAGYGPNSP